MSPRLNGLPERDPAGKLVSFFRANATKPKSVCYVDLDICYFNFLRRKGDGTYVYRRF